MKPTPVTDADRELFDAVFDVLDADGKGYLTPQEFAVFATLQVSSSTECSQRFCQRR